MASSISHLFMNLTTFFLVTLLTTTTVVKTEQHCRNFKSIISFGDSFTDTGNLLALSGFNDQPQSAFPPYGETFFHRPTGRFSNGRLIIDFIAEYLGLPYVPPYFGSKNGNFEKGVNFAVAGETALEQASLESRGILSAYTNLSLGVQLKSFKESLPNLCGSPSDCKEMIGNALIIVGEIGGNDYGYAFTVGKNVEDVKELVPLVISAISSVITELVSMGGRTIMVPSNVPFGCWTSFLTDYQTSNKDEYDPLTGCLKWGNEFIEHHNKELQAELDRLQKLYPSVTILYADYYNASLSLFREPAKFGCTPVLFYLSQQNQRFINRPLSACCGSGGPYNYNTVRQCGSKGVDCCIDPSKYVFWDGVHLTETAYKWITKGLLEGPYTVPAFDSSCLGIEINNGSSGKQYSLSQ